MADRLMFTAHRQTRYPASVAQHLATFIGDDYDTWITGGAAGGDTLAARVAAAAGVPFEVWLPNWAYRHAYPHSIPDDLLGRAAAVHYVVDRPVCADWEYRWRTEKWWVDNFARNAAMVAAATDAAVISPRSPRQLLDERRGGTAQCVRTLKAQGFGRVWWVHDMQVSGVELVDLEAQVSLF